MVRALRMTNQDARKRAYCLKIHELQVVRTKYYLFNRQNIDRNKATGAPQKHHHTLNRWVGTITKGLLEKIQT
jgi:hypothetical protein